MVAWCALRQAIAALTSEVFLFRSRAGGYSRTMRNSRQEATETFVRQIHSIMASVSSFLPRENATSLPVTIDEESPLLTISMTRRVVWTRPQRNATAAHSTSHGMKQTTDDTTAMGRTVWNKRNKTLTASRYTHQRLEPILQERRRCQSNWAWREAVLNRLGQVVTISTSLLAVASRQWLIPLVLAMAAALATARSLLNYSSRQERAAATVVALEELLQEWKRSICSSDDTFPSADAVEATEKLIVQSEQAILREIGST
jgi:hypothetical protein